MSAGVRRCATREPRCQGRGRADLWCVASSRLNHPPPLTTRALLCIHFTGKGLVQSIQKLTDGSAVVLTVAKYRTPRGNDINGKGVTPNLSFSCETGADAVSCLDAALTKG